MKIMFVIPKLTNGGAERVATNLCNCWCKNNKVRIVSIASKESFYELDKKVELCGQDLKINRKNIFTTLGCYIKNYPKSIRFIKNNIMEFKPDCVISFLVEADFLTYLATKKNKNIIKVFSERADPTRRNKIRQLLARKSYSACDLFVCQSEVIYNYYSYISANKKIIVPNPLDTHMLPTPALNERNHNIVSVGRLSKQKNYSLLIKSFIISMDKIPDDSNLIIYGAGPMESVLQNIIDINNMNDRVKLAGVSKDVLNEIKNSALFVLSSNYEGFPNVLLEAMSVGLPVISTDFYTGVAKELIDRENGIVVPINNEIDMSKAIVKMMRDERGREIARSENISVRSKYNVDKIAELWVNNIVRVMESKDEK